MPRTRQRKCSNKSTVLKSVENIEKEEKINQHNFDENVEEIKKKLKSEYERRLLHIEQDFAQININMTKDFLNTKLSDLLESSMTNSTEDFINTLSFSVKKAKLQSSNDEGYLTTESSSESSTDKYPSSLIQYKSSKSKLDTFKTPASHLRTMDSATTFGFITPKVQPNRPLTVLRRPKQGELVISMSGSPVMTGSFMTEDANVNIPLPDGRIISVQPKRGMRPSEIPEIDEDTRDKLITLRDNLNAFVNQ